LDRSEMLRRLQAGEDALEISIQKWQDIVDEKGIDEQADNCALCEQEHGGVCGGCPVKQKTGKTDCRNSPYTKYCFAIKEFGKLRWAKKELEFLKSLRKKEA